jgi:RNA polymerase sigma factor (sigma-70 family)
MTKTRPADEEMRQRVTDHPEALALLTPREAVIMAMRFGLHDGTPHTLDEIGRALGLTRERIRQLEKQALGKLRYPSAGQLAPAAQG